MPGGAFGPPTYAGIPGRGLCAEKRRQRDIEQGWKSLMTTTKDGFEHWLTDVEHKVGVRIADIERINRNGSERAGTWHGKWSQAGVPHTGWECVDVEDVVEPNAVCEMCERAGIISYVHVMRNVAWAGELRVDRVCASGMEQNSGAAQAREKALEWLKERHRAEQQAKEAKRREVAATWIKTADDMLAEGGESLINEREFVMWVWERFISDPGWRISEGDILRFRDIYVRQRRQRKLEEVSKEEYGT